MRQLLLLRHAKSAWDNTAIPDRDRALTSRGRRAAVVMRQVMRELGLVPDLVLVSPAKRALETLEALEPWDDTPLIEPLDTLYLASETQLLGTLQQVAETVRSVLLVGHNPGLHDLALALVARWSAGPVGPAMRGLAKGYPTAALAEFTLTCPWRDIGIGGGRLVRFVTPKSMNGAAGQADGG
jgi:phosphohistidine phosphatase